MSNICLTILLSSAPFAGATLFDVLFWCSKGGITITRRSCITTYKAESDGLGEVGCISTEMHVTPAERSEPGDCTLLPPSRSRASKMHESVLTSRKRLVYLLADSHKICPYMV